MCHIEMGLVGRLLIFIRLQFISLSSTIRNDSNLRQTFQMFPSAEFPNDFPKYCIHAARLVLAAWSVLLSADISRLSVNEFLATFCRFQNRISKLDGFSPFCCELLFERKYGSIKSNHCFTSTAIFFPIRCAISFQKAKSTNFKVLIQSRCEWIEIASKRVPKSVVFKQSW